MTFVSRGDDPPYPPMSERAGLIATGAIVSGPPAPTEAPGGMPLYPRCPGGGTA
jgi:hypothetical protein